MKKTYAVEFKIHYKGTEHDVQVVVPATSEGDAIAGAKMEMKRRRLPTKPYNFVVSEIVKQARVYGIA